MNYNQIAQLIAFFSLCGMLSILVKKIPILITLPEIEEKKKKKKLFFFLKEKIGKLNPFKKISYENFLQKIVYKIRILSLKTENKTFQILQDLKKKALEKKERLNENYWQEIKKKMKK